MNSIYDCILRIYNEFNRINVDRINLTTHIVVKKNDSVVKIYCDFECHQTKYTKGVSIDIKNPCDSEVNLVKFVKDIENIANE